MMRDGKAKPAEVVCHHLQPDQAPEYYRILREKEEDSLQIIIKL
jgi:threonine dehydrogenase-like Zn-dependent dehydrogenase